MKRQCLLLMSFHCFHLNSNNTLPVNTDAAILAVILHKRFSLGIFSYLHCFLRALMKNVARNEILQSDKLCIVLSLKIMYHFFSHHFSHVTICYTVISV